MHKGDLINKISSNHVVPSVKSMQVLEEQSKKSLSKKSGVKCILVCFRSV